MNWICLHLFIARCIFGSNYIFSNVLQAYDGRRFRQEKAI